MAVISLKNVKLSFPNIAEPYIGTSNKPDAKPAPPVYKATFIIQAGDEGFGKFMSEVSKAALDKWQNSGAQILELLKSRPTQRCYGKGSEVINQKTFQVYQGYEGDCTYIKSNNKKKPQLFRADGSPIDPDRDPQGWMEAARKFYGGCLVNAAVSPYGSEYEGVRRISCTLVGIQFAGHGERFGSSDPDVSSMFTTCEVADPYAFQDDVMSALLG
jgi:hypothetical protein